MKGKGSREGGGLKVRNYYAKDEDEDGMSKR